MSLKSSLYGRVVRDRIMPKKKPRSAPTSVRKRRARPATRKRAPARQAVRPDGESPNTAMLVGYARVSTIDQNLTLQRDALTGAGCGKIFVEQMSGAVTDRPELMAATRLHARWRHACCVEARPLGAFDEAAHRDCRRAAGQRHRV